MLQDIAPQLKLEKQSTCGQRDSSLKEVFASCILCQIMVYMNIPMWTYKQIVCCRNGHGEAAPTEDPVEKSAERVKRLKILVQLRKLYRNLLRAERLLATTSPVHQKPSPVKAVKGMQQLPWLCCGFYIGLLCLAYSL